MATYTAVTTVCTIILVIWIAYRLSNPFECTCGYKSWFAGGFRKHLLQGHKWHSAD